MQPCDFTVPLGNFTECPSTDNMGLARCEIQPQPEDQQGLCLPGFCVQTPETWSWGQSLEPWSWGLGGYSIRYETIVEVLEYLQIYFTHF